MVVGKEMLRKYHFPHTKASHIDEENLGSLKFVSSIKCACQRHESLREKYNYLNRSNSACNCKNQLFCVVKLLKISLF